MTNTIELNQKTKSGTIALAGSKICGLALLIDKLLAIDSGNSANRHLIGALINRLHYNSIEIKASSGDDPENFVTRMMEIAEGCSEVDDSRDAVGIATRLLKQSEQKFELDEIEFYSLEYQWKEFLFHLFRSRLKK